MMKFFQVEEKVRAGSVSWIVKCKEMTTIFFHELTQNSEFVTSWVQKMQSISQRTSFTLLSFCPHFSAQKPDCFFFTHLCFRLWQLQLRAGVPWLSSLGPALSSGSAELRGGRPRPRRDRPPGAGAGRLEAPLPSSLRRDDSACCL